MTLVLPPGTRPEVVLAYVVTKLEWLRNQQMKLLAQARETPRRLVTRESHYVWGTRYLLFVVEREVRPSVSMHYRRIVLTVRPESSVLQRAAMMHAWHKSLMHRAIPPLIAKWERVLGVSVEQYFIQRMKTKWGSCNSTAHTFG